MSERSETGEQKDLYAMWRQLYDANEKVWSQASNGFMDSPAFAQWQGRMLETFLGFQKSMKDSATAQLQAANIPTRDDIARLGELILGLEEKVDQLADRMPVQTRGQAPVPPPPPRRAPRAPAARRKTAKTTRASRSR
jgi:polyhydroxyalkanoic acid synthase PhaR subunit